VLVIPELRKRSPGRASAIVALLIVWEIANLAGYLAERMHLYVPAHAEAGASARSEIR
jgi:hypothetical protein